MQRNSKPKTNKTANNAPLDNYDNYPEADLPGQVNSPPRSPGQRRDSKSRIGSILGGRGSILDPANLRGSLLGAPTRKETIVVNKLGSKRDFRALGHAMSKENIDGVDELMLRRKTLGNSKQNAAIPDSLKKRNETDIWLYDEDLEFKKWQLAQGTEWTDSKKEEKLQEIRTERKLEMILLNQKVNDKNSTETSVAQKTSSGKNLQKAVRKSQAALRKSHAATRIAGGKKAVTGKTASDKSASSKNNNNENSQNKNSAENTLNDAGVVGKNNKLMLSRLATIDMIDPHWEQQPESTVSFNRASQIDVEAIFKNRESMIKELDDVALGKKRNDEVDEWVGEQHFEKKVRMFAPLETEGSCFLGPWVNYGPKAWIKACKQDNCQLQAITEDRPESYDWGEVEEDIQGNLTGENVPFYQQVLVYCTWTLWLVIATLCRLVLSSFLAAEQTNLYVAGAEESKSSGMSSIQIFLLTAITDIVFTSIPACYILTLLFDYDTFFDFQKVEPLDVFLRVQFPVLLVQYFLSEEYILLSPYKSTHQSITNVVGYILTLLCSVLILFRSVRRFLGFSDWHLMSRVFVTSFTDDAMRRESVVNQAWLEKNNLQNLLITAGENKDMQMNDEQLAIVARFGSLDGAEDKMAELWAKELVNSKANSANIPNLENIALGRRSTFQVEGEHQMEYYHQPSSGSNHNNNNNIPMPMVSPKIKNKDDSDTDPDTFSHDSTSSEENLNENVYDPEVIERKRRKMHAKMAYKEQQRRAREKAENDKKAKEHALDSRKMTENDEVSLIAIIQGSAALGGVLLFMWANMQIVYLDDWFQESLEDWFPGEAADWLLMLARPLLLAFYQKYFVAYCAGLISQWFQTPYVAQNIPNMINIANGGLNAAMLVNSPDWLNYIGFFVADCLVSFKRCLSLKEFSNYLVAKRIKKVEQALADGPADIDGLGDRNAKFNTKRASTTSTIPDVYEGLTGFKRIKKKIGNFFYEFGLWFLELYAAGSGRIDSRIKGTKINDLDDDKAFAHGVYSECRARTVSTATMLIICSIVYFNFGELSGEGSVYLSDFKAMIDGTPIPAHHALANHKFVSGEGIRHTLDPNQSDIYTAKERRAGALLEMRKFSIENIVGHTSFAPLGIDTIWMLGITLIKDVINDIVTLKLVQHYVSRCAFRWWIGPSVIPKLILSVGMYDGMMVSQMNWVTGMMKDFVRGTADGYESEIIFR